MVQGRSKGTEAGVVFFSGREHELVVLVAKRLDQSTAE